MKVKLVCDHVRRSPQGDTTAWFSNPEGTIQGTVTFHYPEIGDLIHKGHAIEVGDHLEASTAVD
jgi:hypothetical protein